MRVIRHKSFYGPLKPDPSGIDTCALWIGPDEEPTIWEECTIDARAGAEGLKITRGAKRQRFVRCVINGGYEDCADLLGCEDIELIDCRLNLRGSRVGLTIKGGAKNIRVYGCEFSGRPRHWTFIDLGGHTIYPDAPVTEDIFILNCRADARTLSFARTWHARRLALENNQHSCLIDTLAIPEPIWRAYFHLRNA